MGASKLMVNAMIGKPIICALKAVKKARGCLIILLKSAKVSDRPTPNMTSPNTVPTARSTRNVADKLMLAPGF